MGEGREEGKEERREAERRERKRRKRRVEGGWKRSIFPTHIPHPYLAVMVAVSKSSSLGSNATSTPSVTAPDAYTT